MKKNIRTIVIIIVVALVVGAVLGIIFGLFKKTPALPEEQTSTGGVYQPSSLPSVPGSYTGGTSGTQVETGNIEQYYEAQKQRLFTLTSGPVVDYWIASTTEGEAQNSALRARVFYLNEKGEVYEVKDKSKEELFISSNFGVPIYAKQNSDGSKAIVKFDSGKFAMLSLSTKAWTYLGDLSSVAFSPDGKKIAYISESKGTSYIYTRDVSSAKQTLTLVLKIHVSDFNIKWPNVDKIFLIPKSSYNFAGEIWTINLKNKTLSLFSSGKGIGIVFSSFIGKAIKFVSESKDSMAVSVIDLNGKNISNIDSWTVPEKCSFSYDNKNVVFCAVSYAHNKEFSIVLPDDYLKNAAYFKDRITQFNLSDLSNKVVFDIPNFEFDAVNIKDVNDNLFFHNRLDGKLYMYDTKVY
jgi:flagellar basal body-associated protein FliL